MAPNIGSLTSASSAVGATASAANEGTQQAPNTNAEDVPSIVTIEVLGYGGGESDQNDDDPRKGKKL
jgi:hypothetical protein